MALVVISIDRDKLPPHTYAQFVEWVHFHITMSGTCHKDNPLGIRDLEAEVKEVSR